MRQLRAILFVVATVPVLFNPVFAQSSDSSHDSEQTRESDLRERIERLREKERELQEQRRELEGRLVEISERKPDEREERPADAPARAPVVAVADEDASAAALDDVVVTASRSTRLASLVPAATTVVRKEDIQQGRISLNLEESLRRVPGIRVENELGEVPGGRTRIIVRGVGTRANNPAGSGVRGVRVLVDGIPKNNAGGSAQDLINIDLGSAERIEVVRGPSSALYGNQSGGVVNIVSEVGPDEPFVEFNQVAGSHNLFRENLKTGGTIGDFRYMLSAYRSDANGFREQSESHSTGINTKVNYVIDPKSSLTMVLGFDRNTQESPGQLTRGEFKEDPRQANPDFLAGYVFSTVQEFRFGLTYNRELFGNDDLEIRGFYVPRRLWPFQRSPFFVPQDFTNRGVNVKYLNDSPLFGLNNRITVGFDAHDTPLTTGVFGRPDGGTLSARVETVTTFGYYFLNELELLENLVFSAGGRYDRVRFTARELSQGSDQVGVTFTEFTPKLGLTYQLARSVSAYVNYAKGFETPIIGELRRVPGGDFGFNDSLGPQETESYEFGSRGGTLDGRVRWEFAVFRQDIGDFISLTVGDLESPVFQNVTKLEQTGVELGTTLELYPGLTFYSAYTFADYEFDTFVDGAKDFSGNELPGVPRHSLFSDLTYRHHSGILATLELQHSGDFFVDDANTVVNQDYQVLNLRLGHDGVRMGNFMLSPFLGLNNITDETYSAFAFLNEASGRFFNPAPDFNVFGSVPVRYQR